MYNVLYGIECSGDLKGEKKVFPSFLDALNYLKENYGYPDPEDDRMLIWEILPTGHKKVVWHFSGWHWEQNEFGLPQGRYPGDKWDVCTIACNDYKDEDGTERK